MTSHVPPSSFLRPSNTLSRHGFAPCRTRTLSEGHQRRNSLSQVPSTERGQTTRCVPLVSFLSASTASSEIVWMVFPSPISSPKIIPTPLSFILTSHCSPSSWYGNKLSPTMLAGCFCSFCWFVSSGEGTASPISFLAKLLSFDRDSAGRKGATHSQFLSSHLDLLRLNSTAKASTASLWMRVFDLCGSSAAGGFSAGFFTLALAASTILFRFLSSLVSNSTTLDSRNSSKKVAHSSLTVSSASFSELAISS
mmetsp:Transcript_17754/g.58415  ORF Transcript_17754/g.58415 Transcript_17754/m.58415 type:complete len:252 (-) Transcript_17754:205-960(-)